MKINYADEIRQMVTMQDVAQHYAIPVDSHGFTRCPFHNEKTPSLKLYSGGRGWACYGCGKSGSVIDFIMQYFGLNFKTACDRLNFDFKLGLPLGVKLDTRAKKRAVEAKRAREKRLREERKVQDAVYRARQEALDIWCACDLILLKAPELSDDWWLAKKYIDRAAYRLDEAEMEVAAYERRRADNDTRMDCRGLSDRDSV